MAYAEVQLRVAIFAWAERATPDALPVMRTEAQDRTCHAHRGARPQVLDHIFHKPESPACALARSDHLQSGCSLLCGGLCFRRLRFFEKTLNRRGKGRRAGGGGGGERGGAASPTGTQKSADRVLHLQPACSSYRNS